jgi:hypothetical protein
MGGVTENAAIAVRGGELSGPDPAASIGRLLERYLWITSVSFCVSSGEIGIEGIIKPDPSAPDVPSLRMGFMKSLDAVIAVMDAAGARWQAHPYLMISGKAHGQEFGDLLAEVRMKVHAP